MLLKSFLTGFLLLPLMLFGQSSMLNFNHYGVNEGLSQGNVTCMMQDHLGFMWFGSWDGLNVYDGFRNLTFRDSSFKGEKVRGVLINNIIEIDSNRVAIGTYSGLSFFNRNKQEFENYVNGETNENTRLVKLNGGKLLITISNVLMQFDLRSNKFESVSSSLSAKWSLINNKRKNGVNRSEFLFLRLYELIVDPEISIAELKSIVSSKTVNDVFNDQHKKKIYLGCDEGLFTYDVAQKELAGPLLSHSVKSLQALNEFLYIGTQSKGLIVLDMTGESENVQYTYNELSKRSVTGNFIRTMYVDRQQNLWLSVLGSGLNYSSLKPKIAKTIFSYSDLSLDQKQNNYMKAIAEDYDSLLWVASVTGTIWLLNNNNLIVKTISPKEIDPVFLPNSVQSIFIDKKNRKYLLTEKGLFVTGDNTIFKRANSDSLSDSQTYLQTMIDLNDTLFLIGSRAGLMLYNSESNKLSILKNDKIKSNTIHYLYIDKSENIYVNSLFSSIMIFKYENGQLDFKNNISVSLNLKSCYEVNDTLYFASTKGIFVLNKKSFNYFVIGEQDGLPNQNLYSILPDKFNTYFVWCSSNRGIFRYDINSGKIFTIGLNDGLSNLEFNTSASVIRKNGEYVFGGIDGMSILRPENLDGTGSRGNLISFELKFDNASSIDLLRFKAGERFKVPFSNNGFSCRLIQLNFPNFEVPIRYMLKGHDNTWSNGVNPVAVRYSMLPEGKYDFVAQIYDREKGWVDSSFFGIDLQPPWYRSWLAYLCYSIFIIGGIAMVNRIYINKKLQRQREALVRKETLLAERDRISADLHDDLGSTLSSISIYSEAIKKKIIQNDQEKVVELVERIGENARESITNLSDIVWSINPLNDNGGVLFSRMEDFAITILNSKDILMNFKCDPALSGKEFYMQFRQNLFLIFKEAINNIAKYSGATKVEISITKEASKLNMLIIDNGIGFEESRKTVSSKSQVRGGNGLRNMELRATQINGALSIKSNSRGTTVQLIVPFITEKTESISPN